MAVRVGLAGVLLASSASAQYSLPGDRTPALAADVVPYEFQNVAIKEHLGDRLPLELTLHDETGAEVKLGDYFNRGRPVALNFVYHSCPMLCSMVLTGFTSSVRELNGSIGRDFEVVSISFDPKDTPEIARDKKAHWVKTYGRDVEQTNRGWHFLTADALTIKRVTDAVGFSFYYDAKQQQYAHGAAVFLATPEGRLARYLYGIEFPSKDFRFGLAEASAGRGVSTTDHLLLYCYQYDPNSRGYVLVAWKVMRIGAAFSALVLGAMLAGLWFRERQRALAGPAASPGGPTPPPGDHPPLQPNPEG